ncbi:phospholipase B1, membrane-associated-like [Anableps anableps]
MTLFSSGLMTPISDEKGIPQFLQHGTLVDQANELSLYLQSNKDTDENRDWKLVLLFVQLDQLCACEQQISSLLKRVVEEVDNAVQLLRSQLRRTIVSVALWDGGLNTFQKKMCPCIHTHTDGELRRQRATLTHILQESLSELMVQKHWYRDRDSFTVTLQATPLIKGLSSTGKPLGELGASKLTDELMLQLWRNLFQPMINQHNPGHKRNILTLPWPTKDWPFLRTEFNTPSNRRSNAVYPIQTYSGTKLPCEDLSPSSSIPTSVHELRPADIKVVAALGDSLTAGNGIASSPNNTLDVIRQYRGLSWSIGGDENLTTVTTLPNILKHFNPNVRGYSLGVGSQNSKQAFLNQAVPGAKSKNIPSQVHALVNRMKTDTNINFESDWKLITVFVGGNDLCAYCKNSLQLSVKNYIRFLRESLDYLHTKVPRALVNLVEPIHITPLREVQMDTSLKCPTWLLNTLCPCVVMPKPNSEALKVIETVNRGYQRSLHDLVESGRYDTHSNFTVVIQPFLRDITIPRLPDGRPDRSFFSADCFHLSQKSHTLMARSLWNNMLEPLGAKTLHFHQNFNTTFDLKCSTNAGIGAKSTSMLDLNREYKGVSWSIGGDQTLETVTTLPNILKKFNPNLKGFSKGQGQLQKGFNMAVARAKTSELPAQVQALIKAMKGNKEVNFESDWKVVTIYIGTTDLCNYCLDKNKFSPKNYSNNLMLTLDMLYEKVPRVLVNLVDIMQMDVFKTVKKDTPGCSLQQTSSCHCVFNPADNSPEIEELKRINQNYQTEIKYLISGARYDGKEDFAVVLQPFFHHFFIPQTGAGEVDTSFFSVDCFHMSEKAHAQMAIALWNNMLEPVSRKQAYNFTYDRSKIHCPSEASPFIFTKHNSQTELSVPTAEASTITTNLSSPVLPKYSNPIPVWVPVVVGIVSLLGGIIISWLIMSIVQHDIATRVKNTTKTSVSRRAEFRMCCLYVQLKSGT